MIFHIKENMILFFLSLPYFASYGDLKLHILFPANQMLSFLLVTE